MESAVNTRLSFQVPLCFPLNKGCVYLGVFFFMLGLFTCHWVETSGVSLGVWSYCDNSLDGFAVFSCRTLAMLGVSNCLAFARHTMTNITVYGRKHAWVSPVLEVLSACFAGACLVILVCYAANGADSGAIYHYGYSFGLAVLGCCCLLIGGILDVVFALVYQKP
ncbi:uncharacterized protein LOC131930976 [Physella acuta]|uniref:uncharacterized protein LOC131930976 n=1 Tax=Physella acuta TaxID=109671 RepID=UPI0027DB104D|nr:uncharacterized protein LOC131930976 [Physella acuta]